MIMEKCFFLRNLPFFLHAFECITVHSALDLIYSGVISEAFSALLHNFYAIVFLRIVRCGYLHTSYITERGNRVEKRGSAHQSPIHGMHALHREPFNELVFQYLS